LRPNKRKMQGRILFQMYFSEGENAGKKLEVMNVDADQWESLRKVLASTYGEKDILSFMQQELPIHLSREAFLKEEENMRKVKDRDLDELAYIALFSLDVFVRQLDELAESDIMFEWVE